MDRKPLFILLTELYWRISLTPDRRLEKGSKTPGRTISKVFELQH